MTFNFDAKNKTTWETWLWISDYP